MGKFIKAALIGSPVYHSKSPNLYAHMFSTHGVSGSFSVIDLSSGNLHKIREIAQERGLCAFAVTMPHKRDVIKYLDGITDEAEKLMSVNLVTVRGGVFTGYSTDGCGFLHALSAHGCEVSGKRVLIYGCGGAASAVGYALKNAGADVFMTARSKEKLLSAAEKTGVCVQDELDLANTDIFINSTPLGMINHPEFESFDFLRSGKSGLHVCDLVYRPAETLLLKTARAMNFSVQNGEGMLKFQAEAAFSVIMRTFSEN